MKKLVVVRLIGGLGNQMFQYAAGKAFALKVGGTLKIDKTGFEEYFRSYDLGHFNIDSQEATNQEITSLKSKKFFVFNKFIYKEKNHNFSPLIFKQKPPIYLDGYWQSENYFADARDSLLKEFKPKKALSSYSQDITSKIKNSKTPISVHIRRGDYLKKENQSVHGVCSLDYFKNAIRSLEEQYGACSFFIFSDDIQWAKENLVLNGESYFIDENTGDRSYEDMILMSSCDHNIIANSSIQLVGRMAERKPQ